MSNFFSARGCVYRVDTAGAGGAGWYAMRGLLTAVGNSPILVQGIQLAAAELVQPVITLDNSKILYAFGEDFSALTVFGEILLGPAGSQSQSLGYLQNFYSARRVTKALTSPVSVSAPGVAYDMYLTGLQVGRVDPEFHVQPWAMQGVVAALVGGG